MNLKNLENTLDGTGIVFDPASGEFVDKHGHKLGRNQLGELAGKESAPTAGAGNRTLARGLILRALLREQGKEVGGTAQRGRHGVLDELVRLGQLHPQAMQGIFYGR